MREAQACLIPSGVGPVLRAADRAGRVERRLRRAEKLRVRLSKAYHGPGGQVAKPTAEEYRAITSGDEHH